MSLSRLMILGLLAELGPMHGHQVRRHGELTNVQAWGGITGGALYRELHRLAGEGLIRPVREEQVGRRPARTVYEITQDGRLELIVQREAALQSLAGSADAVAVVLLFASGGDHAELRTRLAERRSMVASQLESIATERARLDSQGYLSPLAVAAFRRGELRLEAELRWHDEFDKQIAAELASPASSGAVRSLPGSAARRRPGQPGLRSPAGVAERSQLAEGNPANGY